MKFGFKAWPRGLYQCKSATGQDKQFDCVKVSLLKLLTSDKEVYVFVTVSSVDTSYAIL